MRQNTAADWGKKRYHTAGNWASQQQQERKYDFRPGRSIPILARGVLKSNALGERRITDEIGIEPMLVFGRGNRGLALCCRKPFDTDGCWVGYSRERRPRLYDPFRNLRISFAPEADSWERQFYRYIEDESIPVRGTAWYPVGDETRWQQYYENIHQDVMSLRKSVGKTLIQIAKEEPVLLSKLNEVAFMYTLVDHYNDAQQPNGSDIPSYWDDGVERWLDWIEGRARKLINKKGVSSKERIIARESLKVAIGGQKLGLTPFSPNYMGLIAVGPKGWDTAEKAKAARKERELILQYGRELREESERMDFYVGSIDPVEMVRRARGMWKEWKRHPESSEDQVKYSQQIGFALYVFLRFLQREGEVQTWKEYFPQSKQYFILSNVTDDLGVNLRALKWIRSEMSAEDIDLPFKRLTSVDIETIDAIFQTAYQLVMQRSRMLRAAMDRDFTLNQLREILAFYPRRLLELMISTWEEFESIPDTDINAQLVTSDVFMHYTQAYFYAVGRERFNEEFNRVIQLFALDNSVRRDTLSQLQFRIGSQRQLKDPVRTLTREDIQAIRDTLIRLSQDRKSAQVGRIRNLGIRHTDLKNIIRERWRVFSQANFVNESKASMAFMEAVTAFFRNQAQSKGLLPTLRSILRPDQTEDLGRIHLTKLHFQPSKYQNENRIYLTPEAGRQISQDIEEMFGPEYYAQYEDPESPPLPPRRRRFTTTIGDINLDELRNLLDRIASARGNLRDFTDTAKRVQKTLKEVKKLRNTTIPNQQGKVDIAQITYNTIISEKKMSKDDARALLPVQTDERDRLLGILNDRQADFDRFDNQIAEIVKKGEQATVAESKSVAELKKQRTTANQSLKLAQTNFNNAKKALAKTQATIDAGDAKATTTARGKLRSEKRKLLNLQDDLQEKEASIIMDLNRIIVLAQEQLGVDNAKWGQLLSDLQNSVRNFASDRRVVQEQLDETREQLERLRRQPQQPTRKPLPPLPSDQFDPPSPRRDSMDIASPRYSEEAEALLEERQQNLEELEREAAIMEETGRVSPRQFERIRRLQRQDAELQDRLNQMFQMLDETVDRLSNLEAAFNRQLERNQQLVERINQLGSNGARSEELDRLRDELRQSQEKAANLQANLDELQRAKEQADALQSEKEDLEETVRRLQEENGELETNLENANDENQRNDSTIEDLRRRLGEAESAKNEALQKQTEQVDQIGELRERLGEATGRLQNMERLQRELEETKSQLESLQISASGSDSEKQREIARQEAEIQRLTRELRYASEAVGNMEQARQRISELELNLQNEKFAFEEQEREIVQKQSEIDVLKGRIEQGSSENRALQDRLLASANQLLQAERAKSQLTQEAQRYITQLQLQLNSAENELNQADDDLGNIFASGLRGLGYEATEEQLTLLAEIWNNSYGNLELAILKFTQQVPRPERQPALPGPPQRTLLGPPGQFAPVPQLPYREQAATSPPPGSQLIPYRRRRPTEVVLLPTNDEQPKKGGKRGRESNQTTNGSSETDLKKPKPVPAIAPIPGSNRGRDDFNPNSSDNLSRETEMELEDTEDSGI